MRLDGFENSFDLAHKAVTPSGLPRLRASSLDPAATVSHAQEDTSDYPLAAMSIL